MRRGWLAATVCNRWPSTRNLGHASRVYLMLGIFILLNIGAVCRTPQQALPENCASVTGGLIHCEGTKQVGHRD